MTGRARASRRTDQYDVAVGQRVRAARKLHGFSQSQLATAIGVSFQQVQKYENGGNRISCSTLKVISTALAVPMISLLGEAAAPTTDALRVDPAVLKTARRLQELPEPSRKLIDALVSTLTRGPKMDEAA